MRATVVPGSGRLGKPGIVVHGVALKPGKPICLAVTGAKPVVVLPGFPTSAIFTYQEFAVPLMRAFAVERQNLPETAEATLPARVNPSSGVPSSSWSPSSACRAVIRARWPLIPRRKGSGAVTAFTHADGSSP